MAFLTSAALLAGGGLVASHLNRQNQRANRHAAGDDRAWQEQQAQNQMNFQREMSNTTWQRGVQDMQQAGLNPALMAMGGHGAAPASAGAMPGGDGGMLKAVQQANQQMFQLAQTAMLVGGMSGAKRAQVVAANERQARQIMHSEWKHLTPGRKRR